MKRDELQNCLKLKDTTLTEIVEDMNPLTIVAHEEFNRQESPLQRAFPDRTKMDYRERAIKRVLNAKVDFHSDSNTTSDLIKQIVPYVHCPVCHAPTSPVSGGGGDSHVWTANYQCPTCKTKVSLSMPHDGISVSFWQEST
jgi:hypothetical protein